MRSLLIASLIVLAACQPKAPKATAAPEGSAASEPAASPQFASSAVPFSAVSKAAQSVTGNIRLTALSPTGPNDTASMKLESDLGLGYETDLIPGGGVNARNIDWTGVFGHPVDPDDSIANGSLVLDIHAVALEAAPLDVAAGLCGKEKASHLAVAFPIDAPEGRLMGIAAFKGGVWPPKDTHALCGVYTYAPPP